VPQFRKLSTPNIRGEEASLADVLALAGEYRKAALKLAELGRRGEPTSWAPFRLCAIHALELHLNALLVHSGEPAARIRGLQHKTWAPGLPRRRGLVWCCGRSTRSQLLSGPAVRRHRSPKPSVLLRSPNHFA
jgi:hypothetical protein